MDIFGGLRKKVSAMRKEAEMKDKVHKEAELQAWNEIKPELVKYYKQKELSRLTKKDGGVNPWRFGKDVAIKEKPAKTKHTAIIPAIGFGQPLDLNAGSIFGIGDEPKEDKMKNKKHKKQKEEKKESMFEIHNIFEEPKKGKKEPSMFEMRSIF